MKAKQFTALAVALFALCAANVQAQTATTTTSPKGDAAYGMQPASSATSGATAADRKAARTQRTADAKTDAKTGGAKTEASLGAQPASSATSGATKAERRAARAKRNAEAKASAKQGGDAVKSTPN